jgi:hypothetical protein
MEKILWAVFSAVGPALHRPRCIFVCEAARQPITAPLSPTDGACLSALSSPKSPLLFSPTWQRRPNCRRRADHPSPPRTTRMATCSPATLSHRVSYGAPWHPITAARLRLPSSALHRLDSGADRLAMKSSSRPLRWPSFHYRMHAVEAII